MDDDDDYSELPKDLGFHEHDILDIASKAIFKGKYDNERISAVWEKLCKFIESSYLMKRGVCIREFGLFTFYEDSMPHSATHSLWIHQPLFLMDKILCESYGLNCKRIPPATKIVTVYPNYTVIASLAGCSRFSAEEMVMGIVKAVRRLCSMREDFKLPFPYIGTLTVKKRTATMHFRRQFTNKLHQNVINPTALSRNFHASQRDSEPCDGDNESL